MSKKETLLHLAEQASAPAISRVRTQSEIQVLVEETAQSLVALSNEFRSALAANQRTLDQSTKVLRSTIGLVNSRMKRAEQTLMFWSFLAGLMFGLALAALWMTWPRP